MSHLKNIRPMQKSGFSTTSRLFAICSLGLLAIVVPETALAREKAAAADEFANSVGVNIRLSSSDGVKRSNLPLVRASVAELGIRHVRTRLSLSVVPELNQLAADGRRIDLIIPVNLPLSSFQAGEMPFLQGIESLEAPDHCDETGALWKQDLLAILPRLRNGVLSAAGAAPYPVIGPALTRPSSYSILGDVASYSDYGNLPKYLNGRNPGAADRAGFGSMDSNLVEMTNPGEPVITTEAGYTNQGGVAGGVPAEIAARYLPRLLLEQWNAGIGRTYLSELMSSGESDYGLLTRDGAEKPAFRSIASLMRILSDPGPSFTPDALDYTLSGGDQNLHHALFQKRDGSFYLALWLEQSGYNTATKRTLAVRAERVTLAFQTPITQVTAYALQDNGYALAQELNAEQGFSVQVSDRLTVYRIATTSSTTLHNMPTALAGNAPSVAGSKTGGTTVRVLAATTTPTEHAVPADYLVDSAGVNVHLGRRDTPYYTSYPAVLAALKQLGVRHVRDEFSDMGTDQKSFFYERHNDLAAAGIRSSFDIPVNASAATLLAYPTMVKGLEGYEGANEYDRSGDPNWQSTLVAWQRTLYATIKSNSQTSKYPVLAPALATASLWPQVASVSQYADYCNVHDYFAGFNPGTTNSYSIPAAVQAVRGNCGNLPVITTETGYIYQTFMHLVPDVAGTYAPRVLLEQFFNGIRRTYIYELLDTDATQFGLMTSTVQPRPAFTAMSSFLKLLSDPGTTVFTPSNLQLAVTGNVANVRHLLMQKRNGSYYLAIWIESQDYDQVHQAYLSVPNQAVTVSVPTLSGAPVAYQFTSSGSLTTQNLAANPQIALSVSQHVTIVEFSAAAAN